LDKEDENLKNYVGKEDTLINGDLVDNFGDDDIGENLKNNVGKY